MAERLGQSWGKRDHQAVMGVSTSEWAAYMRDTWQLELEPAEIIEEIVGRMRGFYGERIPFRPYAVAAVDLAARALPHGARVGVRSQFDRAGYDLT